MIQLGRLKDGRLLIASNQELPADILRVEYYREQRLFSLVYENDAEDGELMPIEIPCEISDIIKNSPNIMVVALANGKTEPYGYQVPLVQIGV